MWKSNKDHDVFKSCLFCCCFFYIELQRSSIIIIRTDKMGNQHPISNHWGTTNERSVRCAQCPTAVEGLEHVADMFVDDRNRKTYIFYHFSNERGSTTIGVSGGGPSASVTIPAGSPLIKALRRDGKRHMCVGCFEKCFPDVFKSVALSLQGKAAFVNSDYTLNRVSYGSGRS